MIYTPPLAGRLQEIVAVGKTDETAEGRRRKDAPFRGSERAQGQRRKPRGRRKNLQSKENKKLSRWFEFFDPPIVDYIKHYIIGFPILAIFF